MKNLEGLEDFFRQELYQIIQKRKNQLSPAMEVAEEDLGYVILLLLRFSSLEIFKENFTNTPLFDLASKRQAFSRSQIQGLADFCLFRVGFFPLAFGRRHMPPRKNFIIAGRSAYLELSHVLHPALLFLSLGKNFLLFTNLISELRLRNANNIDVMELLELWEETGSHFAEDQLRRMKVVPMRLKT